MKRTAKQDKDKNEQAMSNEKQIKTNTKQQYKKENNKSDVIKRYQESKEL